ncbi:indolepyruvate oxidoreductase subunit beta family protein [Rubellimicrobium roseum]|uniref:indolepyruvate oxidoreductase subunit beta family protein n=1 Tax=Rubellimicrobium roseum TaxID=687525 RepID=UPI001FE6DF5C|nr:indolepyruvate oxidoreductase subunit beta family protein [Rubellimicrobium roseum]
MTVQEPVTAADPRLGGIIKLAVLAVGGQGGGVLTGWIEDLARANGYAAQATSVAGVAQRTGATVYYVEMCPVTDRAPVFSLMPAAGDVDVLIAAEMMEAGRAILRGFVTPDRTTLVASTHRALAVSEKMVPGDGIASSDEVRAAAEVAARRIVMADFEAIAGANGSVISASLFGGLAASGALPFPREAFEAAIRAGGKGIEGSLRAFGAAYEAALAAPLAVEAPAVQPAIGAGPTHLRGEWERLLARVRRMPEPVAEMAGAGLRKVVDFQDLRYGAEYLDRLEAIVARDDAGRGHLLSREVAKHLANAMAYDDVIRVADLKTRDSRFRRIAGEMGAQEGRLLHLTEFMHPRAEEIVGLFPAPLGARLEGSARAMRLLGRVFARGRRLRTDRLPSFLLLHALGGLKDWRRRTLRHGREVAHREAWLALALGQQDYDLAVEVIRCRRLIKGYSDTHARGLSKFDRVLEALPLLKGRPDAAEWLRRLREAALKDEAGKALDDALRTVRSFA